MLMYLIAPPVVFALLAIVAAVVIAIASRLVRRADWLEQRAAAKAAEEQGQDGEPTA